MKTVRIIARLNIGGPAIHTILLSSALNTGADRDILVCGRVSESEGDMIYLAREKGVTPVIIPSLGRDIDLWKDLAALAGIIGVLLRERPDVVHTHTAKAGTLGRIAAILCGVPVRIHTFHGHVFDGYFSPRRAKIFAAIERFLARFSDRVITVSERVRSDIVGRLDIASSEKCIVVPLGLELSRFSGAGRKKGALKKELGIPDGALVVAIVGRLVPIKNHEMFLDAARLVRERVGGRDVRFLIVGDGELRPLLEKRANEFGLASSTLFTGWIEDVSRVYADADVVALTSLNEGTPVSLIEAMAASLPVVSTDVGGVNDVVKGSETGLLVRSGDASAFADAVVRLLASADLRNEIGARARKDVLERFSVDRLVGDLRRLYTECLAKKRSSPLTERGAV